MARRRISKMDVGEMRTRGGAPAQVLAVETPPQSRENSDESTSHGPYIPPSPMQPSMLSMLRSLRTPFAGAEAPVAPATRKVYIKDTPMKQIRVSRRSHLADPHTSYGHNGLPSYNESPHFLLPTPKPSAAAGEDCGRDQWSAEAARWAVTPGSHGQRSAQTSATKSGGTPSSAGLARRRSISGSGGSSSVFIATPPPPAVPLLSSSSGSSSSNDSKENRQLQGENRQLRADLGRD